MHGAYEGVTDRALEDRRPSGEGGRATRQRPALDIARPSSSYERAVKPLLDRVIATLLIVVLSPVLLTVAMLVRLQLGSGVIYRQYRIGQHGTPFQMYKFRTMEPDRRRAPTGETRPDRRSNTDRRQVALDIAGPDRRTTGERRKHDMGRRQTHKTPDDPRHTRLGRFLRTSSLDELPQLFNVLRGELSLVGPRPELPEVVAGYRSWEHARHHVKPGITGLWQVTERADDKPMHEHVDTDIRYVDGLSASMDARILLLTVPVLLGFTRDGRGA